jgi:hypothetical protein
MWKETNDAVDRYIAARKSYDEMRRRNIEKTTRLIEELTEELIGTIKEN